MEIYEKALNVLNNGFGYIDVENDEDYNKDEIIEIAKNKLADLFYDEDYLKLFEVIGIKVNNPKDAEIALEDYWRL